MTYNSHMDKVSISILKSQLSEVLRAVKKGKDFLVMDRNHAVAHLSQMPVSHGLSGEHDILIQSLYEQGILDLPEQPKVSGAWLKKNLIRAKASAVQALLNEREEALF